MKKANRTNNDTLIFSNISEIAFSYFREVWALGNKTVRFSKVPSALADSRKKQSLHQIASCLPHSENLIQFWGSISFYVDINRGHRDTLIQVDRPLNRVQIQDLGATRTADIPIQRHLTKTAKLSDDIQFENRIPLYFSHANYK